MRLSPIVTLFYGENMLGHPSKAWKLEIVEALRKALEEQ